MLDINYILELLLLLSQEQNDLHRQTERHLLRWSSVQSQCPLIEGYSSRRQQVELEKDEEARRAIIRYRKLY